MKTKEELNALREEIEAMNKKLTELNEEEMDQVTGGGNFADELLPRLKDGSSKMLQDLLNRD